MIERDYALPIKRQAELVSISRGSAYYRTKPVSAADLELMRRMAITALYRKPNTSRKATGHKIYPYLLRTLAFTRANQVWSMDISYIPMARGFVYLAAVIDWHSRRVLAWRLSISMDTEFCTDAVEEAIARHGTPEIFNTDQGSQFTSAEIIPAQLFEFLQLKPSSMVGQTVPRF